MLDMADWGTTLYVGMPLRMPVKYGREPNGALVGSAMDGVTVPNWSVKLPARSLSVGMVMYCGVLLIAVKWYPSYAPKKKSLSFRMGPASDPP